MRLAFDTNILIELDLLNKALIEKLRELRKDTVLNPTIPSPVVSEYYYGFLGLGKKERALENLGKFEVINTSKESALLFAELKHRLGKAGNTIPDMDVFIASICIDNNLTLVSYDKQFEKITELKKIILNF